MAAQPPATTVGGEPWLGQYQNVNLEGSEAYLTDHQRSTLQHFRQEHGSGFFFHLRNGWENFSERTGLLMRRVSGDESDAEGYDGMGSPVVGLFRRKRVRQVMFGGLLLMLILFILSLFTHSGRGGRGAPRAVPKNLKPLAPFQDQLCMNIAYEKAPPGKKFIQIHNQCSGEVIYPAMIGVGGGSVEPAFLEDKGKSSWRFEPGDCKTLLIPAIYPSMRLWGRTGCNGTDVTNFKCQTGDCVVNGDLSCTSAGQVSSLFEGTFQGYCPAPGTPPIPLIGPDFYDLSLVDGYNLPMSVELIGGVDVAGVSKDMNCVNPTVYPIDQEDCPPELRFYSDRLPGWSVPEASIEGRAIETSPCYVRPADKTCYNKFAGCMSLCKAFDEGWIGYYIDNVQGDPNVVNPYVTPLSSGPKLRWSRQFTHGNETKCGVGACRDYLAYGAYRQGAYAEGGHTMKDLVCCSGTFSCSPYQPNNGPGCSFASACPTLGAGDPTSKFHATMKGKDLSYPQEDQELRFSSTWPDWPLSTTGKNYAEIYKEANPNVYVWQYNDGSHSLALCCGEENKGTPHYRITFCPSD